MTSFMRSSKTFFEPCVNSPSRISFLPFICGSKKLQLGWLCELSGQMDFAWRVKNSFCSFVTDWPNAGIHVKDPKMNPMHQYFIVTLLLIILSIRSILTVMPTAFCLYRLTPFGRVFHCIFYFHWLQGKTACFRRVYFSNPQSNHHHPLIQFLLFSFLKMSFKKGY